MPPAMRKGDAGAVVGAASLCGSEKELVLVRRVLGATLAPTAPFAP